MPDLSFEVETAAAVPYAAAPLLAFKLRLSNAVVGEPIHKQAIAAGHFDADDHVSLPKGALRNSGAFSLACARSGQIGSLPGCRRPARFWSSTTASRTATS